MEAVSGVLAIQTALCRPEATFQNSSTDSKQRERYLLALTIAGTETAETYSDALDMCMLEDRDHNGEPTVDVTSAIANIRICTGATRSALSVAGCSTLGHDFCDTRAHSAALLQPNECVPWVLHVISEIYMATVSAISMASTHETRRTTRRTNALQRSQ